MATPNKTQQQASDILFVAAYAKYFAPPNALNVNGVPYNPTQVTTAFQVLISARNSVKTERGAYINAIVAEKAIETGSKPLCDGARQMVRVMYANDVSVLAEFGMVPRKKAVMTTAAKQAAAIKAKATRAARHTMGPKAKLAITGAVAPATAPATVAAAAVATPAATAAGPAVGTASTTGK